MGKVMQDQGISDVYVMAPNYAAARTWSTGSSAPTGRIVDRGVYAPSGDDYQGRALAAALEEPKACSCSIRAGWASRSCGSTRSRPVAGSFPLYSVYTVDEISIPAVKHAALGRTKPLLEPGSEERGDQKYVSNTARNTARCRCSTRAQSYDGILLIDWRCVRSRAIWRTERHDRRDAQGRFRLTRGKFQLQHNHFPIQNFYLLKTGRPVPAARIR